MALRQVLVGSGCRTTPIVSGLSLRGHQSSVCKFSCCVALYAREHVERGSGACAMALGLQTHAHNAVEDEGREVDHGVGANAVAAIDKICVRA